LNETASSSTGAHAFVTIRPIEECRSAWRELTDHSPRASLYHSFEWQRVLNRAYGLKFHVALLDNAGRLAAGALFAPASRPFSSRLIALPFSDYCPPLSVDGALAEKTLLRELVANSRSTGHFEIHGVSASAPWQIVDCFAHWTLDLQRPFAAIEKSMDRNFKRQTRRATESGVTVETGSSEAHAKRFYLLHLETRRRLGLPAPPWRFFRLVQEIFSERDRFEVYLAAADGKDVAAAVLLKDGSRLHCKWSARCANPPLGATHLLFSQFCEQYAGSFGTLDLGRTDVRNQGLNRFKRELGAVSNPLPYAFYPAASSLVSSEHTGGVAGIVSNVWRNLPMPIARVIGGAAYKYLS